MNLISCDHCGVVFDANKLPFADDPRNDDGDVDPEKAAWDPVKREFVPCVWCRICGGAIQKPD